MNESNYNYNIIICLCSLLNHGMEIEGNQTKFKINFWRSKEYQGCIFSCYSADIDDVDALLDNVDIENAYYTNVMLLLLDIRLEMLLLQLFIIKVMGILMTPIMMLMIRPMEVMMKKMMITILISRCPK